MIRQRIFKKISKLILCCFLLSLTVMPQTVYCQVSEIDRFINKSTITLLGRMPTDGEKKVILKKINENSEIGNAHASTIDWLMSKQDFYINIEEQLRNEYLEGFTESDLITEIKDFYFLDVTR